MLRRKSREIALKILYSLDTNKQEIKEVINDHIKHFQEIRLDQEYLESLLKGIISNKAEIDELIKVNLRKWKLERLPATDRIILQIATYEICFDVSIPAKVAINEAVEIAKRYSPDESPNFINGILDSIRKNKENESKNNS
ncbi:MAG: transcription antitermination factor NusB [Pseudomonadota bacterium]